MTHLMVCAHSAHNTDPNEYTPQELSFVASYIEHMNDAGQKYDPLNVQNIIEALYEGDSHLSNDEIEALENNPAALLSDAKIIECSKQYWRRVAEYHAYHEVYAGNC